MRPCVNVEGQRAQEKAMPVIVDGQQYYYLNEVAKTLHVHPSTLHRWFRTGEVREVARDRHGWRIFTEDDIAVLRLFITQTSPGEGDIHGA